MDNAILWLVRLVSAHLLTDFFLQPGTWVQARRERHLRAAPFWYHILLTAAMAAIFTGFDSWWTAPAVLLTHGLIDWWKSHQPENFRYFMIDQSLHLAVILTLWLIRFPEMLPAPEQFTELLTDTKYGVAILALAFLTRPAGIAIGLLTKRFRDQIPQHDERSLEKAGIWIGILERFVIFFLVLLDEYGAIGLLVAAKSILRLKDDERKMSEYVLIGTLLSIATAMVTALLVTRIP
jgi:hypothetical protein